MNGMLNVGRECVFRFVKSELKLEDCQSFEAVQHYNHIGFCFLTYALLTAAFPDLNDEEHRKTNNSMRMNGL